MQLALRSRVGESRHAVHPSVNYTGDCRRADVGVQQRMS
jgi:hypothetical protein